MSSPLSKTIRAGRSPLSDWFPVSGVAQTALARALASASSILIPSFAASHPTYFWIFWPLAGFVISSAKSAAVGGLGRAGSRSAAFGELCAARRHDRGADLEHLDRLGEHRNRGCFAGLHDALRLGLELVGLALADLRALRVRHQRVDLGRELRDLVGLIAVRDLLLERLVLGVERVGPLGFLGQIRRGGLERLGLLRELGLGPLIQRLDIRQPCRPPRLLARLALPRRARTHR